MFVDLKNKEKLSSEGVPSRKNFGKNFCSRELSYL